jgi:hypothetical protein
MACVLTANPDIICSTHDIPAKTVRQVLGSSTVDGNIRKWRIPVFQRRYCWGELQLKKFVHDIINICAIPPPVDNLIRGSGFGGNLHDLGRIVVSEDRQGNFVVIDGQQRLSTISIMLSTMRDFLRASKFVSPVVASYATDLIGICNSALLSQSGSCLLEPSYFDRSSYASCVIADSTLNPHRESLGEEAGDGIMKARQFFSSLLQHDRQLLRSVARKIGSGQKHSRTPLTEEDTCSAITSIIAAILDKLCVYLFVVRESDVQSVYERLAMREALVASSAHNYAPGVSMAECDLVRNFITSYFGEDTAKIEAYLTYWAPVEELVLAAATQGTRTGGLNQVGCEERGATTASSRTAAMSGDALLSCESLASTRQRLRMDEVLRRFAASRSLSPSPSDHEPDSPPPTPAIADLWLDPGADFFPIYAAVKACVYDALRRRGLPVRMRAPSLAAEEAVLVLLQELLAYVLEPACVECADNTPATAALWRMRSMSVSELGCGAVEGEEEEEEEAEDFFGASGASSTTYIYRPQQQQQQQLGTQSGQLQSTLPRPPAVAGRGGPGGGAGPCLCMSRGTLCTDCIVKKYGKK